MTAHKYYFFIRVATWCSKKISTDRMQNLLEVIKELGNTRGLKVGGELI